MKDRDCSFVLSTAARITRRRPSQADVYKCCARPELHVPGIPRNSAGPSIVFVTPNGFCQDQENALQKTQDVIAAGVSLVQIRDRIATKSEIKRLVHLLLSAGVRPSNLSLNGFPPSDVMSLSPELGVHIRETDISEYAPEAMAMVPRNTAVGCSVHSVSSAKHAMKILAPTYIQVGTMFTTNSHPGKIPEGPSLMRAIRQAVGPEQGLIGIGGIGEHNLHEVFESGATGVAVISTIAASTNAYEATSDLVKSCREKFEEAQSSK